MSQITGPHARLPALRGYSDPAVRALVARWTPATTQLEDVSPWVRLNAALDRLFILRAGQAGVYVGARGDTQVATLGADSLLGEMEFVDHQPASAEVVMLTSGEAVEIAYAPLRALCESAPLVGYRLLSNIAEIISLKLRATNAQLAPPSNAVP